MIASSKPVEWGKNPCGCRGCNVCGFYGHAPRPRPNPSPIPPRENDTIARARPPELTLFDEVLAIIDPTLQDSK